ncbi:MAG: hypothetical protein GC134_04190 [Proteobacteria bacterium]|nr:hypothetical protein [Pseudomonadota bacterium]
MHLIIACCLCILLLQPVMCQAEPLTMHYGVNDVDMNGDGVDDIIVKSRWENGNAHSFDRYLALINCKDELCREGVYEVPLGLMEKGSFVTSEGAGCASESPNGLSQLTDYTFEKDENGLLVITKYARDFGENYSSKMPVTITSYKFSDALKEGEMSIGLPRFYFKEVSKRTTEDKYCNVRDLIR